MYKKKTIKKKENYGSDLKYLTLLFVHKLSIQNLTLKLKVKQKYLFLWKVKTDVQAQIVKIFWFLSNLPIELTLIIKIFNHFYNTTWYAEEISIFIYTRRGFSYLLQTDYYPLHGS